MKKPIVFIHGMFQNPKSWEKWIAYFNELNKRNAEAYSDEVSISEFKSFPNRGHWICGQQGWEEVAEYISEWLTAHEDYQYHTESTNFKA